MKWFLIEWETDYMDDFPEQSGVMRIQAKNIDEAVDKFHQNKLTKALIMNIRVENFIQEFGKNYLYYKEYENASI